MRGHICGFGAVLAGLALIGVTLVGARAEGAAARNQPSTRVMVVGPGAERAAARHGTVLARLPIVGGVSAAVRTQELAALGSERGVTRVVRDTPMRQDATTRVGARSSFTASVGPAAS